MAQESSLESDDYEQVTHEHQTEQEHEHNLEGEHEDPTAAAAAAADEVAADDSTGPVSEESGEPALTSEPAYDKLEVSTVGVDEEGDKEEVDEPQVGAIDTIVEGEELDQEQENQQEDVKGTQSHDDVGPSNNMMNVHTQDDLDDNNKKETSVENEEVDSALAATAGDDESLSAGQYRVDEEKETQRVDEELADDERDQVDVNDHYLDESQRTGFTQNGSFIAIDDGSKTLADMVNEAEHFDSVINNMEYSEGEMEPVDVQTNREKLLEKYHHALSERQQLQEHNYQLQHRLVELFRLRRSDDVKINEGSTSEQEKRYLSYMASLDGLHRQAAADSQLVHKEIEELSAVCAVKDDEVSAEHLRLVEYKKHIALSAVSSRSGRAMQAQNVEQYLLADQKKEAEVIGVRLENIKLKNKLKKHEAQLKSKEELADGLHLIDFEQLKIENQTYNEKIEERNEELQKLRRKITSTVQVLTHLKEKLQFVYGENQFQKDKLREIEELVARKRDALSRTKQVRDGLRIDNHRLNQTSGLLGKTLLLRDLEVRHDDSEQLQHHLTQLKMTHAELTLNLGGVRRKIDASKVA